MSIHQEDIIVINVYEPNNKIHEAITEKNDEKDRQFNDVCWRIQNCNSNDGYSNQTQAQKGKRRLEEHYQPTRPNRHNRVLRPTTAEYTFF